VTNANKNYESKSRGLSVLVLRFLIQHEMFLDPSQLLLGWDIVDWCLRVLIKLLLDGLIAELSIVMDFQRLSENTKCDLQSSHDFTHN